MGGPRTIVGVRVTNVGSDLGSQVPMVAQVERRKGALPGARGVGAGLMSRAAGERRARAALR